MDRHTRATNAGFPAIKPTVSQRPLRGLYLRPCQICGQEGQQVTPTIGSLRERSAPLAAQAGNWCSCCNAEPGILHGKVMDPSYMEPGHGASNDVPSLSLISSSGGGADNESYPSRVMERLTRATTGGGPGPVYCTHSRNVLPSSSLPLN